MKRPWIGLPWIIALVLGAIAIVALVPRGHDPYARARDEIRYQCSAKHIDKEPVEVSSTYTYFPRDGTQVYDYLDFRAGRKVVRVWGPFDEGVKYIVKSCAGDRE